ncbi:MAG: P1 family peptidase [Acidimicrobiales bacterium]
MALGIEDVTVGVVTDTDNSTGCTVVLAPPGSVGGIAVRGGAPGTREAAVLGRASPSTAIHAVALCGSSLFGLSAAGGVADWCAAHEVGLELPGGRFPIVGAAVVMDVHSPAERRIDRQDGWDACEVATTDHPAEGSVGAGTGCTVGKEAGRDWGSKGGQGWAICAEGEITVGALMIVNAFGSVYRDSDLLAGSRAPADYPRYPATPPAGLFDASGEPVGEAEWGSMTNGPTTNTVIGVVVTNATLTKSEACRVADLAHSGIARTVSPAHTTLDGDAIFAIATGTGEASADLIADMASSAVANAIHSAVINATAMAGWPVDERAKRP